MYAYAYVCTVHVWRYGLLHVRPDVQEHTPCLKVLGPSGDTHRISHAICVYCYGGEYWFIRGMIKYGGGGGQKVARGSFHPQAFWGSLLTPRAWDGAVVCRYAQMAPEVRELLSDVVHCVGIVPLDPQLTCCTLGLVGCSTFSGEGQLRARATQAAAGFDSTTQTALSRRGAAAAKRIFLLLTFEFRNCSALNFKSHLRV